MKTIKISDETYEAIKDQLGESKIKEVNDFKDMIGESYFFRTITYHLIGKVEKQLGQFLELSTASWIADSGRFMQAIKDGKLNEVEPVGKWYVNLEAVSDFGPWVHDLPTEQK